MAMDEAKKIEGNGEKTVDAPHSRWIRRNSGVPVIKKTVVLELMRKARCNE